MSIDINNANFKIFTDFAATAKQSARAQLESKTELNGEMRTVKPAGGLDFIGNVGRLSKHKAAHDTVRNLFRETVTGMFGGEERIPENVLKAMKLDDELATPMKNFVGSVMLQRLGPSKLRSVQNALTGRTAAQLNYAAKKVGEYGIEDIPTTPEDLRLAVMGDREKDIPRKLRDELRDAINVLGVQKMSVMSAIIGEILDEEPQELPDLPENEAWTDDTLTVLEEVKNYVVEKNGIEITMEE